MKKTLLFSFLTLGFGFMLIMNSVDAEGNYSKDFQNAYKFAYKNGITTTNSIDKAKMNSPLTRIAMAKMLSNYAINVLGKVPNTSKTIKFSDVTEKQNANYNNAVYLAYQLGIMGQGTNKFRPNDEVTRAEFATALSRMLYSTPDGNPYYTTHLKKLKQEGIITNDNPKIKEKRGYVMVMLMRSQSTGTSTKENNTTNNTANNTNNNTIKNTNNNEKYLTQDEVKKLIEKEEGLKEDSLLSTEVECYNDKCNYGFEYSANGEKYIYNRDNTVSGKTKKVQDLGINNAEEVALKDANISRNDSKIKDSFSSNGYIITISTKDNVFVYTISLDGKIKEKKVLITEEKALKIILKEVNLEQSQSDIEKENEEMCSLSFDEKYQCSFTHGGKQYTSYINAKDGTFIPIKKTSSGIQYGKSVTGKENVVISDVYSYIDYDEAEELLIKKYNIKEGSSWTMKVGDGDNAIYIYNVDGSEYYISASNGTKMYSKDEIFTSLAKDSGVSKDIIKNSKKSFKDSDSIDDGIIEMSYSDIKTHEVVSIYSFINQGTTYTYKIRNIDGKILNSKKETDIGEDKAKDLAKQTILKKYSTDLNEEQIYYWNRAYIWYQSSATSDEYFKTPSEPEYVVCFTDKDEKNIYRVILKPDGSIISNDKTSIEEMGFLGSLYYVMGYSLDEIDELKDESLEIGGSISI